MKAKDVEDVLNIVKQLIENESKTLSYYAIKLDDMENLTCCSNSKTHCSGVFDVFIRV